MKRWLKSECVQSQYGAQDNKVPRMGAESLQLYAGYAMSRKSQFEKCKLCWDFGAVDRANGPRY